MFIAEIGINHNGDLEHAKELIEMAKIAGADVVKFQKRDVEICIPDDMKNVLKKTPWGDMTYLNYKRMLEFSKNDYNRIDSWCRKIGIKWAASVWDIPSLQFISSYDTPFIKIPSACITDLKLLYSVRILKRPVIISTGMSTLKEIRKCVSILSKCDLTILHCNSSYPAEDDELDLNVIGTLKRFYPKHKIGYSGHEKSIYPSIIAGALGAEVVERHITLDKNMWGTDQSASLTFKELSELIYALKKLPVWLGGKDIKVYASELKIKDKLRRI